MFENSKEASVPQPGESHGNEVRELMGVTVVNNTQGLVSHHEDLSFYDL